MVLTAICNRPFIVTKEEADKMFPPRIKKPLTDEEREKIRMKAERWFKKPEDRTPEEMAL